MKSVKCIIFLAVTIITLTMMSSSAVACWCEPGTGTPGYWKNHPEAWPVDVISIGGTTYTVAQAIMLMNTPVRNDKSITMFKALVASKLSALAIEAAGSGCGGCSPPGCILEADQWLINFPVLSGITAKTEAWQYSHGEALYECMDDFNNGLLCAPSRDYCEDH